MIALLVASLVLLTVGFGLVLRELRRTQVDTRFAAISEHLTHLCDAAAHHEACASEARRHIDNHASVLRDAIDEHGRDGAAQFQALGEALDDHAAEILDRLPVRVALPPVPELPQVARAEKTVADIAAAVEAQHEAIREQVAVHLRQVMVGAVSRLDARGVGEHAALQLRDAWLALRTERDAGARLSTALAKSHAEQDRLADALKAAEDQARTRLGEVRANGEETAQRWLTLAHRRGQVLRDVRRAFHVGAVDESDALSRFCAEWAPRVEEGLSGEGEAIHVMPPLDIDEEALERRYWQFDYQHTKGGESMRDAFKGQLREVLRGMHGLPLVQHPPLPVLPWRPASEVPPASHLGQMSLSLPVRLDDGTTAIGYQYKGQWWLDDKVVGAVTHWLPLEALQQTHDADTESELREYDALVKSIHEALGQDGDASDALIVPAIKALRERPVPSSLEAAILPLKEKLAAAYLHRDPQAHDLCGAVFNALSLHGTLPASAAALVPVATPETLGVRSQPGLARTLTAEAARVVEHAVAVLRPLVPGGEGLDPASLCAAVRTNCDEADAALTEAHVVTQKSGSHYTLGQRVVILAGREREAREERDALRDQISEVMAARDAESQTTLRTMAGLREQVQQYRDACAVQVELRKSLAEQVRQIRAVAFDPQTSMPRKVAEIQHLLQHDGVEDPAVKPAPVTEFPHPTTGRDPLTATDAPPAEYAAEADALGVQS